MCLENFSHCSCEISCLKKSSPVSPIATTFSYFDKLTRSSTRLSDLFLYSSEGWIPTEQAYIFIFVTYFFMSKKESKSTETHKA